MQALLKGLACSGLDYEEVANRSRIPLEVTTVYLNWFFDYIERKDDGVLTASILNPKTELSVAKSTEAQDPVWLAIQAGHKQGPDAVIRLLRLNTRRSGVGNGNQMANIKHVLLSSAEMKAELGMLDARDPDFLYFKGLSIVEAKQQSPFESEDDKMGFGRISADKSCQAIIKQVTQAAAVEKLRLAQEYDARDAAAVEAKRKAAEGAAAGDTPA